MSCLLSTQSGRPRAVECGWRPARGLRRGPWCVLAGWALFAVGCERPDPAQFRLNMVTMTERGVSTGQQETIAATLVAMFGTPDEPYALPSAGLDLAKLKRAAGPVEGNVGLYRRHCAHCHGITGDGQGPTAPFLNPYPRDYRPGIFKFKSTAQAAKPTREDLMRVLDHGIPGTAMPSFLLLSPSEKEDLIEYVIYLAMRGEIESSLASAVFDMSEPDEETLQAIETEVRAEIKTSGEQLSDREVAGRVQDQAMTKAIEADIINPEVLVQGSLVELAEKWSTAPETIVRPDPEIAPSDTRSTGEVLASVEAGRALFFSERAGCVKCHGRTALGDGQTNDFDVWNKRIIEFAKTVVPPPEPEPPQVDSSASAEDRQAAEADHQAALFKFDRDVVLYDVKQRVLAAELPPRNLHPRNLRHGVYRGGRRPLDIYRKIAVGIEGALMPASAKKTPDAKVGLSEQEIWQLVDYVHSLPYEPASRPAEAWSDWQREHMLNPGR